MPQTLYISDENVMKKLNRIAAIEGVKDISEMVKRILKFYYEHFEKGIGN